MLVVFDKLFLNFFKGRLALFVELCFFFVLRDLVKVIGLDFLLVALELFDGAIECPNFDTKCLFHRCVHF